jgi:hypothetical protein
MRPAADKRDSVYFAGRSYPAWRGSVEKPGLANVAASVLALLGFATPEGYLPGLVK